MCAVRKFGSFVRFLKRELNLDVTACICVQVRPVEGADGDQGRTGVWNGHVHQRTRVMI